MEKALGLPKGLRAAASVLAAVALLGTSVAFAPRALADAGGSVALVPVAPVLGGASDKVAGQVTALLEAELGKSETLRFVPLGGGPAASADGVSEVAATAGGGSEPFHGAGDRALAQGKGLIVRAEREMRKLRLDQAAADLQQGIAAVESSFDSLESFQLLVDAYLALAIAKLQLRQNAEGQAALDAVIRLEPDMTKPRGRYPAVFLRMIRETHDRLVNEQGTLTVASTVPGQTISLDGRDAGVTPATLKVVPGRHFVILRGGSGQIAYRVDVPENGEAQVGGGSSRHVVASAPARPAAAPVSSGDLRAVRDEIRANLVDGPGDEALRRLAHAAGAQFLVLGGLHVLGDAGNLGLDLFLYAAGPDQLSQLPRVTFDGELLGAQVEIYKAVQGLAAKANPQGFADALTLPAPVAGDYNPKPHKAAGAPIAKVEKQPAKTEAPPASDDDDETIQLQTGNPKPRGEGEARASPKPRTIEASDVDSTVLETPSKEEEGKKKEGGGLGTWGIIGITALAIVAVGVGTYFTVAAVTAKPTSSQITPTWSYP